MMSSSDAIPDKGSDANMVLRAEAEVFERSSFGFERARFSVSRTYYDLDSSVVLVADVGQLERSDFSVTEY